MLCVCQIKEVAELPNKDRHSMNTIKQGFSLSLYQCTTAK